MGASVIGGKLGTLIVRLGENKYVEWSSIVDAPTSAVMSAGDMKDRVFQIERTQAGVDREQDQKVRDIAMKLATTRAEQRWQRVERTGTSSHEGLSVAQIISGNRAGEGETELSIDEIIDLYTYDESKKNKFPFS